MFVLSAVIPAFAGVIVFNNFGPGNTSGCCGGTVGDGAFLGNDGIALSTSFQAAITAPLASISMAAAHCGNGSICGGIPPRNPNSNAVIMSLYDNSAFGGGNLLEQIMVIGQMQPELEQTDAFVTGPSVLHPLLVAGVTYWLVATVPNMKTDTTGWHVSTTPSPLGNSLFEKVGSGPWEFLSSSEPAFEITGVPEPDVKYPLCVVCAAVVVLRKRLLPFRKPAKYSLCHEIGDRYSRRHRY